MNQQAQVPSAARTIVLAFALVFCAGVCLLVADFEVTGLLADNFPLIEGVVARMLIIGLIASLCVVFGYLAWRLWPVGRLLGRLRRGLPVVVEQRRHAAVYAMQLPEGLLVGSVLVVLGTGLVLWFSGLLLARWPLDVPLRQLFALLASILLFGAICYLSLRRLLRPALVAFEMPHLPSHHRFGLRLRMVLWLSLLTLVVVVPVMVLDASTSGKLLDELSIAKINLAPKTSESDLQILLSTPRLLALLLAVVFAAIVGWLLGQELRSPVHAIGRRLDDIRTGKATGGLLPARLLEKLPIHSATEIGRAAAAFNRLTDWLESEHQKLGRYAERVKLTAQIRASFLANVSHELKTPLNSIIGFSDLLLRGYEGELSERQTEDIKVINREGLVLLRLINDILLRARLEAGKESFQPEKTALVELLDIIAAELDVTAKPLQTLVSEEDSLAEIMVDGFKLKRAVAAMIEHIREGDSSRAVGLQAEILTDNILRLRVTSPHFSLQSQDNWRTPSEDFQPMPISFSPGRGLALGLSLALLIAKLHKGWIGFVTTADGQGIEIRLPLLRQGYAGQA